MCGIVAISGTKPVTERLLSGLARLEYRGYDSAGIATLDGGRIARQRAEGKIKALRSRLDDAPLAGTTGIAHTRWATHGRPSEPNAHPHISGRVAIVHNGIIENYVDLKAELESVGRTFTSETDSEVIAQLFDHLLGEGLGVEAAFEGMLARLTGAFAIAAIVEGEPGLLLGARRGSPLVVGHGKGETYLGSDSIALAPLTRDVTYLEEGDWVIARPDRVEIYDASGRPADRPKVRSRVQSTMIELGEFDHFMLKEIHEQSDSLTRTILPYIDQAAQSVRLGEAAEALFAGADRAVAVACGTAYYAAATAKYWFERFARLPLETDIASEFRYRDPVLPASGPALFVSQSGETADTLAALRYCKAAGTSTLAIVNVPESSIAREADAILPTRAGPEIGVASTKAFTAQLAVLAAAAVAAGRARGQLDASAMAAHAADLMAVPRGVSEALAQETAIRRIAGDLASARDVLFLGRGVFNPLALEAALKLKEVSYIHAEGYAAGELKHGPIALIEDGVPVVIVAPMDDLFQKTVSNMQEVQARGAKVILISDAAGLDAAGKRPDHVIEMPTAGALAQPILAAVPVQLLAYHTALAKGCDVDQPRNLAKSVTVE